MSVELPLEVRDPDRLQSVADLDLAGRNRDASFDDLASASAALIGAPIAFFTVIDAEHCWYVGAAGLPDGVEPAWPIDLSYCKHVLATGHAVVINDATADPRTADDENVRATGLAAWAGFPVRDVRGQIVGVFGVADPEARAWTAVQIEALRVLARSASDLVQLRLALQAERRSRSDAELAWLAAESARLDLDAARRREHAVIDLIQRSLLPARLPQVDGLDTAVRFEASNDAADIGGDWYDLVVHREGEATLIIGDVCGHDLPAIAVMAQVRHYLHVLALREADPLIVLAELDSLMLEHDFDRFATVAMLHWSQATGRLGYVLAGHPPPLVVRADGTASYLVEGRRPPVNLGLAHAAPEVGVATLGAGDAVILFTDGLYESWTPDPDVGLERLRVAALAAHGAGPQALVDTLLADMRPEGGWTDDVAILVAQATDDRG